MAFSPLAAGVLVEAGGFEGSPGEQMGESVEEQQIGFEPADFIGDVGTFPALAFDDLAASAIGDGGRVAFRAAANVDADNAAIDAARAGVIASAIGAGFPGHERRVLEAAQT
jgi:hypothetical protein